MSSFIALNYPKNIPDFCAGFLRANLNDFNSV